MRLLIATPLYPPDPGGPATYAKALEEGLPGRGILITLVKYGDVRDLPKGLSHIAYFWNIYKGAKDADAVLALDPASTGLPAALAALCAGKPFFVKIVGDYAWEQGTQRSGITATPDDFVQMHHVPALVSFLRTVQTFVARRAKRVIVPSEYLKRIVVAWGIPAEKITVIYNGVEKGEGGVVPKEVAMLPRPLVLTAGRLVPWKGIGILIDAVELARKKVPSLSLVIVGDGPERKMLEKHAKEILNDNYSFAGLRTHAETLASIASADVFALNTSYEGFSHLLIETLAEGTPIVTTAVGGNVELIQDGENGLFAPLNDAAAIAERIERIVGDRALATRLSSAGKETAHTFTTEAMLTTTAAFFHTHI